MSLKWVCITVGLLALFALGVLAGFFVLHFPFIEFNNEIGIFDALHFLLALGLGIWVPFVIKKAIEDKRDIKAYIVEGIKDFIDDDNLFPYLEKIISEKQYKRIKFEILDC